MEIEIKRAAFEDKSVLRNLLELYAYDFSEFDDADVDEHGIYGYSYLDNYWTEKERHPFLVKVDGRLAGLVLIREVEEPGVGRVYDLAEFFILKKYRQQGIGRKAACRVFDLFPGQWKVCELASNLPAQAFWRKVIDEYTGGKFDEVWADDEHWLGPIQRFEALKKSKA